VTKLPTFTSTDTGKLVLRASAIMRKTVVITLDLVANHVTFAATPTFVASGISDATPKVVVGDAAIDSLGIIPMEWSSQVESQLLPFIAKVYDRGAQQVVAGVNDVVPTLEKTTLPKISDDATLTYLQQAANRIRFLSDEMWEIARNELITGHMNGESIAELAARVRNVAELSEKQALTVARTEVMAALNGGQYAQMRQLAEWGELTVTKKWEATDDRIVRPSHAKADGQEQPLDGYFSVGGKSLRYPGDPSGGGEAINCRCTVLYDVDSTSLETLSAAAVVVADGENFHLKGKHNQLDHGHHGHGHKIAIDSNHISKILKRMSKARTGDKARSLVQSTDLFAPKDHKGKPSYSGVYDKDTIDGFINHLESYQNDAFYINSVLRQDLEDNWNIDSSGWVHGHPELTSTLDKGFDHPKSKLKKDIVVERGIQDPNLVWGDTWSDTESNVGLTWDDAGYTSTTTDSKISQYFTADEHEGHITGKPVLMRILVSEGTGVIRPGDISVDKFKHESEVILPRKSQFRIVADNGVGADGIHRIDVELVSSSTLVASGSKEKSVKSLEPQQMKRTDVTQFIDVGPTVKIVAGSTRKTTLQYNIEFVKAIVATGKKFDPTEHPRGNDGKFIKKDFLPGNLLEVIKSSFDLEGIKDAEWDEIVSDVSKLTSTHWSALKPEQKEKITNVTNEALNVGVPGSGHASMHLEDLDNDELLIVDENETPNVFIPPAQSSSSSPFKLNPNKGKSGDGYAAKGLWGKYGAAGLLIQAPSPTLGEPVYLMVQRGPMVSSNKGKWQLPGGAIDEKETFEEGAARELFEEVGASEAFLAQMSKVGSHDINVPIEGKKPWTYSNIAAKAPETFEPHIDGTETGDAKWLTKDEILGMKDAGLLHPALAKEIDSVFGVFTKKKDDEKTKLEVGEFSDLAGTPGTVTVEDDDGMGDMGDGSDSTASWDTVIKNITDKAHAAVAKPQTTFTPKPIKITHALIHKKHSAGTTIAVSPDNEFRIHWNGSYYVIQSKTSDNTWETEEIAKKSKLYNLLAEEYGSLDWVEPGKLANNAPPAATPKKMGGKKLVDQPYHKSPLTTVPVSRLQHTSPSHISKKDALTLHSTFKSKLGIDVENASPEQIWQALEETVAVHKKQKSKYGSNLSPADVVAIHDWVSAQLININAPNKHELFNKLNIWIKSNNVKSPLTPAPGSPDTPLDLTGWKKIGSQQGSNLGGLFEAPDGTRYYVKKAKSQQHAANEVLANQLYAAVGIDVPEVQHGVNAPGIGNVVVSKIVPNTKSDLQSKLSDGPYLQKVQEGFAIDAWLANWDVVGLGYDNIVTADGKPWRIDNGGALLYRAQGAPKGNAFGDNVTELETLKKMSMNPTASTVFGGMSTSQEIDSAKKLLGISDDKIKQMVKDSGLSAPLADKLIARKNFILEKYGLLNQNKDQMPVIDITDKVGPVFNENAISNWDGVVNNVHFNYGDGDVIAVTDNDKLRIVKKIDSGGDVFYDMQKHHVEGHWFSWVSGIDPEQLGIEADIEASSNNTQWLLAPKPGKASLPTDSQAMIDAFTNTSITPNQIFDLAQKMDVGEAIATGKDSLGETWKATKINTPDKVAIHKGTGAGWEFYALADLDTMKKDSGDVKWAPTGHALLTQKNLKNVAATKASEPNWNLSATSIWDVHQDYPIGTVFAEGTSKGGTKYRLINGEFNGATILTAEQQLDSGSWDVLSEIAYPGVLDAWINSDSMGGKWQIPGSTIATPDVNALNPIGNQPPNTPTNDISHLDMGLKYKFYNHFKKLNISPSWSPKAIYEKLIQAQQTSSDSDIQGLNLPQLLAVVDWGVPWTSKSKNGESQFSDKVLPWSQTLAGQKVMTNDHWKQLKDFNKPAYATGKIPAPASSLPKVNQVNAPVTPKSPTVPIPIPGAEGHAKNALEVSDVPANKIGTAAVRKSVYAKFKEASSGKYLKDDVEATWKNLINTQKAFPTLSMLDIIKIVDQGRADHTKATNKQEFEAKIKAWLSTKDGYMTATHEMPFDADAVLKHNAPSVATLIPLSHQSERTKAEVLAMSSSEFKVISTDTATAWYHKQKITGAQKSAMKKYTGSYYHTINSALRLKTKPGPSVLADAKSMQDGMRPLDQDILLHRGTSFDQFGGVKSHEDLEKLLGKTVQDKAFMSSSVGGTAAFGGSVLMEIEVPKGTGAMFVKPFSHFANEREMLLSAGLRFRVLSVTKKGYQSVVRVRVVPPPDGSV